MAMGDPANEPGNPDGCQIDKASIKKATSSLARLSAVFIRTAAIIESSVRQMVQSIQAVGKVKVKGGGGGAGASRAEDGSGEDGGKIELPFNMRVWENTRKKAKKQEKDAARFRKKMAKLDAKAAKVREKAERKAIQDEESEIIGNAKKLLNALNKKKDAEQKEIEKNAIKGLSVRNAVTQKEEAEIISNARKLLTALNKKNDTEEREIEKNAIKGLSARNAAIKEEEKIIGNAKRMLAALNKKKLKKEEAAAEQDRKEIERNAMAGLRARNAIRLAQEKEQEARAKFFADQEKEMLRQAPFAYSIGKAIGYISGNLFKTIGSLVGIKKPEKTEELDTNPIDALEAEHELILSKSMEASKNWKDSLQVINDLFEDLSSESKSTLSGVLYDFASHFGSIGPELNTFQEIMRDFGSKINDAKAAGTDLGKSLTSLNLLSEIFNELPSFFAEWSQVVGESDSKLKSIAKKIDDLDIDGKPPVKRKGFANGGKVSGSDAKGTDTVPAMLTPGEFVVSKKAAQQNRGELEAMNQGKKRKTRYYAAGGLVAAGARAIGGAARGAGAAGRGVAAGLDASGFQGAANAMLRISAGAERVVGSLNLLNLATLGPVDSFNKLVSFAGSFVEAVNPALMQQLGLAFKDLQAIIGVGLQPIIAAAIPIIRAFADKLQPVMQALMPTFDKLAQSMIELSGPIITLVIEMFGALEPVIETVSVSIQAFAGILTAVTPIIAAVFKELIYRITQIVTTFQWFIGKIISWIPGTGDTGKKLMESASAASKTADLYYQGESKVQKAIEAPVEKGASAGAAAQKASISGISDFGKNLMQQAFSSSTQASAAKTAENTEKMHNELARIREQMGRIDPAAPAAGVRRAGA
jgi:hypothetical protein